MDRDDPKLDWDEANIQHIARHGITVAEVESVLRNDFLELDYDEAAGEPRWAVAGHATGLRVLVVVFTLRNEKWRPITAYDAPRPIQAQYWKERF